MNSLIRVVMLALAVVVLPAWAQSLESLSWRSIGPARGGRVSSVSGVVGERDTYYMGATGGGVWKTTNAGESWFNVTDGFVGTGSVGDVVVAPSDPNVVYVGMGEPDPRGNFSHGDGVYRSTDAGKTWTHLGLDDTRQIGRIAVHPRDPDVVVVAALGHVYGTNDQRGVYRSTNGGDSWTRVLHVDDRTGAIDVTYDPHNPRVLFAAMWQMKRTPWGMDSGGRGSALYRSLDGGETWSLCERGLPKGLKGKIGVSVSGAERDLVYAIVEAEDGGVFRSTNGGDSWRRVNDDRNLRQRAWYYSRIIADPNEADTVYVMNVGFHKSIDGGASFSSIRVPHSDNHALWIDPHDSDRMVNGNDGGANVSENGGDSWSRQDNQPTAQFYHVAVDNAYPYRVYGAQQDNSTVSISSTNRPGWREDFYAVGGGESGYIAPHPEDNNIVYAGSYMGFLTRYDHRLGKSRNIHIWPDNTMGAGAGTSKHRFQWTFPIVISPHDPDVVYVGGERVFRTDNGGQSWEAISEDLTRNDPTKLVSSGGPITKDNTSVEYYCTVFTIAESPVRAGRLWAGTDDGLVHVLDDGEWTDVTPTGMGDWPQISLVDASPHDEDVAWLAVNRYKMNDFTPMIYRTRDRGATWDLITEGIDDGAFVRAVREDPERPGLLYAATETGMYVSTDFGDHWSSLQINLPRTPVTDVVVKDDDLVISTQGRSFWILGGLSYLRQQGTEEDGLHLYESPVAYRDRRGAALVRYHAPEDGSVTLTIRDDGGDEVRSWDLDAKKGLNTHRWNLRREDPVRVPGAVGWPGTPGGARVIPGEYTVELTMGETTRDVTLHVEADPRLDTTPEDFQAQQELLDRIYAALEDVNTGINRIRSIRSQIEDLVARAKKVDADEVVEASRPILKRLASVEDELIQSKSKAPQDPLNYPVRLNDKIASLVHMTDSDYRPTDQTVAVFEMHRTTLDGLLEQIESIRTDVEALNETAHQARIPAVIID